MESMAHAEPCEGYLKRGMTRKNEGETRRRMKQSQSEVSKQTGHWLHNTNFFLFSRKRREAAMLFAKSVPLCRPLRMHVYTLAQPLQWLFQNFTLLNPDGGLNR